MVLIVIVNSPIRMGWGRNNMFGGWRLRFWCLNKEVKLVVRLSRDLECKMLNEDGWGQDEDRMEKSEDQIEMTRIRMMEKTNEGNLLLIYIFGVDRGSWCSDIRAYESTVQYKKQQELQVFGQSVTEILSWLYELQVLGQPWTYYQRCSAVTCSQK